MFNNIHRKYKYVSLVKKNLQGILNFLKNIFKFNFRGGNTGVKLQGRGTQSAVCQPCQNNFCEKDSISVFYVRRK